MTVYFIIEKDLNTGRSEVFNFYKKKSVAEEIMATLVDAKTPLNFEYHMEEKALG